MFIIKSTHLSLILLCLLAPTACQTKPMSYSDMFGWYNNIKDEYKELSPFHGFVAFETGFIKNLYLLGNLEYTGNLGERYVKITGGDATVKLVHNLFHLVINEFDITTLATSPATYLDAQAIATILKEFHDPTSEKNLEESITNAIQESILRDHLKDNPSIDQLNTCIKEVQSHLKIITNNNTLSLVNAIKEFNKIKFQDLEKIKQRLPTGTRVAKAEAYDDLKKIHTKNIVEIKSLTKIFQSPLYTDAKKLGDLIIEAAKECGFFNKESEAKYPGCYFYWIFLGYLYCKSTTDKDKIPAFHTYANAFTPSILNNQQKWKAPSSLDPKNPLQAAKSIEDAVARYEEFAYHKINNLKNRAFPPMVRYKRIKYQTPTYPEHEAEFATCVETMMFNLFQILLMKAGMFNCSTQRFDTTHFDTQFKTIFNTASSQLPVIETTDETATLTQIKKFFDNLYAAEELSDEKMIEWCKILANQKNIVYKNKAGDKQEKFYFFKEDSDVVNTIKDKDITLQAVTDKDYIYEIKAFPSNILRALNDIFDTDFTTWKELLTNLRLTVQAENTQDPFNHTYTLIIESQAYQETFNLELKSTHGTLSMATNSIVQPENNILELLFNSQETLELDKHLLLMLLINAAATKQNDYTFTTLKQQLSIYIQTILKNKLLGQHFIFSHLSTEKIRLSTRTSKIILKYSTAFSPLIQRLFDRFLLMNTLGITQIITGENPNLLMNELVINSYIKNKNRLDPESIADLILATIRTSNDHPSVFAHYNDKHLYKLYKVLIDLFEKNPDFLESRFSLPFFISFRIKGNINLRRSKYLFPLLNWHNEKSIPEEKKKSINGVLQQAFNNQDDLDANMIKLAQRIAQESFFNSFDHQGNTALHLAGLSDNKDVITLFKQEPAVDQAALNKNNKRFDQIAAQ